MAAQSTTERSDVITMRGKPMTLVGPALKAGDPAPNFTVTAGDMSAFTLADATANGTRAALLIAVPSLDTPVCSTETTTFNGLVPDLPSDVTAFLISMDLPFAQKRWSGEKGVEKIQMLSDFRERSFGPAYGVLIKELGLLARAVFVVTKDGKIGYAQIVPEVASEPNYDEAIAAAKAR